MKRYIMCDEIRPGQWPTSHCKDARCLGFVCIHLNQEFNTWVYMRSEVHAVKFEVMPGMNFGSWFHDCKDDLGETEDEQEDWCVRDNVNLSCLSLNTIITLILLVGS